MPDSDFQPEKRTVEDLFVGPDYFLIPRFQRPYSWDRDTVRFWAMSSMTISQDTSSALWLHGVTR